VGEDDIDSKSESLLSMASGEQSVFSTRSSPQQNRFLYDHRIGLVKRNWARNATGAEAASSANPDND